MKTFTKTDVSISEAVKRPEIIKTTGRERMWQLVNRTGSINKWWGEGSNAAVSKAISLGYKKNYLLHNDWLRIKYDYGIIGITLFFLTILFQLIHMNKFLKFKPYIIKILGLSAVSEFIPLW